MFSVRFVLKVLAQNVNRYLMGRFHAKRIRRSNMVTGCNKVMYIDVPNVNAK